MYWKYIIHIYASGSAHVKFGVRINASPKLLFPAEGGVKNE